MMMMGKKLVGILFILCFALDLFAQVDSTFVRYYNPTYETHPYWVSFPTSGTYAANMFEKYDGNFGMQILSTFHTPPPEMVFPQSPIASYNRRGEYINTSFGPCNDDGLLFGYYSHIIRDGYGGYLALDMFEHKIHRLNSDLQFVEWVPLLYVNGTPGGIFDLIGEDNGFIVVGNSGGNVIAKFSYDLTCLWSTSLPFNHHQRLRKLNDGSCIILWRYNPYFRVMKVSSTGDSIWVKQIQCEVADDFIEFNYNFYGFIYDSINISTAELRVYDFGVDFDNEDPGDPILVIPTYPLLDNNLYGLGEPFSVIKTSDNCIILAVSSPGGEIYKFDSSFNLIWSSNALQDERIGIGNHPLIELGNGDLLYCATVGHQPRRLALVRIDSNGIYVGIEDDTEQTPAPSVISAYPNPFTIELNVNLKNNTTGENKLEFYNIRGQLVESMTFRGSSITWTPQHLATGMYIVKYINNNKLLSSKMITYIK